MKKIIFLVTIIFLFSCYVGHAHKSGEKIQIESNGSWYDGKILKVNAAEKKYFVSYDRWSESWNEWVGVERIIGFAQAEEEPLPAPKKFKVGDCVEAEYGMISGPATVIEVCENKYHIQYDKMVFGTRWVTEKQIKKL
jgi:hypothetical protein